MLEIIYRIYEVADPKTAEENRKRSEEFGLYSSVSKTENTEIVMDCLVCESREAFKDLIREQYGNNIVFRYSKKLKAGDLYCVIIGEHCYNTERYFNKITFKCDCCNAQISTYYGKPICFSDYEMKNLLYNISDFASKRFCSHHCKQEYYEKTKRTLSLNDDNEFYIDKDMFSNNEINGYIYKITKKSTGEFYVGKTVNAPIFRWGQHLKSERFHISDIKDYIFETIEIVSKSDNILEREKYWIQKCYKERPHKSLNIMCTANIDTNAENQLNLFETDKKD